MRKLALLGVLAAFAGNAWADDAEEKKQKAQQEVRETEAEAGKEAREAKADAQKEAQEAQAKAGEKVEDARKEAREETREAQQEGTASGSADRNRDPAASGMDDDVRRTNEAGGNASAVNQGTGAGYGSGSDKHPLFTKDNFDIEGTIQSASSGSITLQRKELPAAKLNVDRNTKIELDGKQVSAAQLQPGQEVKASFNLQNDKPMAVEIKAEKKD